MFRTLFNIVLLFVGLGISAHASDFQLLNSELEFIIPADSTGDLYQLTNSHHQFFDVQTENYSVVTNADREPTRTNKTSTYADNLYYRSHYLSLLQNAQFNLEAHSRFYMFRLRKTLYPFHSFW